MLHNNYMVDSRALNQFRQANNEWLPYLIIIWLVHELKTGSTEQIMSGTSMSYINGVSAEW